MDQTEGPLGGSKSKRNAKRSNLSPPLSKDDEAPTAGFWKCRRRPEKGGDSAKERKRVWLRLEGQWGAQGRPRTRRKNTKHERKGGRRTLRQWGKNRGVKWGVFEQGVNGPATSGGRALCIESSVGQTIWVRGRPSAAARTEEATGVFGNSPGSRWLGDRAVRGGAQADLREEKRWAKGLVKPRNGTKDESSVTKNSPRSK